MRTLRIVRRWEGFAALILVIGGTRDAWARGRDLSSGVSFPSSNSAVIENPAALSTTIDPTVDLTMFFDSSYATQGGYGAYARNIHDGFGAGLVIDESSLNGGIGFGGNKSGSVGLGIGHPWAPGTGSSTNDVYAGFRRPIGNTEVGLTVHNLSSPSLLALGLGRTFGANTVGEMDFIFSGSPLWDPSNVYLFPAIVMSNGKTLSFKLAYRFTLLPGFDFNPNNFSLAASIRINQNLKIYIGRGDVWYSTWAVGVRLTR